MVWALYVVAVAGLIARWTPGRLLANHRRHTPTDEEAPTRVDGPTSAGRPIGNFLEGSRETTVNPQVIWDILANVNAWPTTFTPHLKEAHLEGAIEVGSKGWVQTRIPIPKSHFEITSVEEGLAGPGPARSYG